MILPLRRRHRRMFAVIGIILPIALIAGIAARKPVPTLTLPAQLTAENQAFTVQQWDRSDLFRKTAVHVRLLREAANSNRLAVGLSASKDFVKADLLVYWLPANSTITGTIPDDAILLGALVSGQPLPMPPTVAEKSGRLILYSLADHEIVETSKVFTVQ